MPLQKCLPFKKIYKRDFGAVQIIVMGNLMAS